MISQKALNIIQDSFCCFVANDRWHMCSCYELNFVDRFILYAQYNNFVVNDTKRYSKIVGILF